jgi:IS1 family transposase
LEIDQGMSWIWTALDVPTRLMVHSIIGERTLERAVEFIQVLKSRTSKKPLFVSDELPHYEHALVNTYSTVVEPPRTGKRGRPRGPQRIIDTDLDYATVHKTRSKGRVVKVERTCVLGNQERITARLQNSDSNTINTSFVERLNLTLRMMNAHLSRKSLRFAKSLRWLRARFSFIDAFYNFVRPHRSLSSSHHPVTPAMAAKITEKPWSMDQLLSYAVVC